jgi:integrase
MLVRNHNPTPGDAAKGVIVATAITGQRLRRSMSRRSGQSGSVERKRGFYVVRYWEDKAGQEKRVHRSVQICPVSGPGSMTKPERARRAQEIIEESGADTAAHFRQVVAVNLGTTFRQQSEWWIRHVQDRKRKPVKPHTVSSWKSHLKWINSRVGDVPLSNVNNLALKELVSKMSEVGFTPKTITLYAAVVKMVVASAIDPDGEVVYPRKWNHEFIDLPTVVDQRTPIFTAQEVEQIISAAEGQFRVLYTLLAATGLRAGEALALEVGHFHDGAKIQVSQGLWNGKLQSPKTRAGYREVDLPSGMVPMLESFIGDRTSGFIFRARNGRPLHQAEVLCHNLHPILASVGLAKCGFHAFRRFRVTHLRKQGCPEDLLRFWIGHADTNVTDRFSKPSEDTTYRKAVAERMGLGFNLELVPQCPPTLDESQSLQTLVM